MPDCHHQSTLIPTLWNFQCPKLLKFNPPTNKTILSSKMVKIYDNMHHQPNVTWGNNKNIVWTVATSGHCQCNTYFFIHPSNIYIYILALVVGLWLAKQYIRLIKSQNVTIISLKMDIINISPIKPCLMFLITRRIFIVPEFFNRPVNEHEKWKTSL